MEEHEIKKANHLFPKMFKTFTLYIFSTLLVFFGYVQLFGDVKPNIIQLPTDSTDAADDTYFGSFVQSIMGLENLDTNVKISFSSADGSTNLALDGNVIYAQEGIGLDLNLIYNQQNFAVKATYVDSNLFLNLGENAYVFDSASVAELTGGSGAKVDFAKILKVVTEILGIDTSFVDELGKFLGIDFSNFNPNELLSMLKIDEKMLDEGGYDFKIKLGSAIEAHLVCDERFNIISAQTNNILISNNTFKIVADVNKQNNTDVKTGETAVVEVSYEKTGEEIDLSGLGLYAGYAKNLFENNQYVCADVNVKLGQENYAGKLFVDTAQKPKVKFVTNISGIELEVAAAEETLFLNAGGLKLKVAMKDFALWKNKIEELVEKHTGTQASQVLKNLLSKFVNIEKLEKLNAKEILQQVLNTVFENSGTIGAFLPQQAILSENDFVLLWDVNNKQAEVCLMQNLQTLSSVSAKFEDNQVFVKLIAQEAGFEIEGQHFDVTNLLPIADVVDEILLAKQLGGTIVLEASGNKIEGQYVVDFASAPVANIKTTLFGLEIEFFATETEIIIKVGEVVLSAQISQLDTVLQKLEKIFGFKLDGIKKPQAEQVVLLVKEILQKIKLSENESVLAMVECLDGFGSIEVINKTATIKFESLMCGTITMGATQQQIQLPQDAQKIDNVLQKLENLKAYAKKQQFAFMFDVSFGNLKLSGMAEIDLKQNLFQISGLMLGGHELKARLEDDVAYLEYADNKFKISLTNTAQFAATVFEIVSANLGLYKTQPLAKSDAQNNENTFDFVLEAISEMFGEDLSKLSLAEALKKLSVQLVGTTDNLEFLATFNSTKPVCASVKTSFNQNMLETIELNLQEKFFAVLNIKDFAISALTEEEKSQFFELSSAMTGNLKVNCQVEKDGKPQTLQLEAKIEVDLTAGLYVRVATTLFGKQLQLLICDNQLFVSFDEVCVSADLCNAKQLLEEVVALFEIQLPNFGEAALDLNQIFQMLEKTDLNAVDAMQFLLQQGISINTTENNITVDFAFGQNMKALLVLENKQSFEKISAPQNAQDVYAFLPKIKNLVDYLKRGIFEFDFTFTYNNWQIVGQTQEEANGKFKWFDGEAEIVCNNLCGQTLGIRLHTDKQTLQQTVFVEYGNMKFALPIVQNSNGLNQKVDVMQQINKLTSGQFGFVLNFGVFEEILHILQTYTLQDYLQKIVVGFDGTNNNFNLSFANKNQATTTQLFDANIAFENEKISTITLGVLNNVFAEIFVNDVENSTIKTFDKADFADFENHFMDGLLDSLQVEENVFAFSSDIAIRYSNNTFYGKLTAMVVEQQKQTEDGKLVQELTPAISLYTTSLGLSVYLYLINQTLYLDVDGLQISAKLDETTIAEVMDFVKKNFSALLPNHAQNADTLQNNNVADTLKTTAQAFKVIIPALDRVYGKWVSYVAQQGEVNGIQIELGKHVLRDEIVQIEQVYNPETEQFDEIEHISNDVKDYGGESNVLMYQQDAWLYNILLQTFVQNQNNTIVPTKIVLGANIHDKNTTLYADYSSSLLSCEEEVTQKLNFAVYLTNISVGSEVENLNSIFVCKDGFQNIFAVKSNVSDKSFVLNESETQAENIVTKLEDFNSYKSVLGAVEAIYSYAMAMEYQLALDGSIESESLTTSLNGAVTVQAGELADLNETNNSGFKLFNDKFLNVFLDGLTITQKGFKASDNEVQEKIDQQHIVDLRYRSTSEDPAIYLTYTHSNFADDPSVMQNNNIATQDNEGAKFHAKISNEKLGTILSMILAFANVQLGEKVTNGLGLAENTTDFAFLQKLLGINKQIDADETISKVDGLLSSIENITNMLKQVSLQTLQDNTAVFTIKLDLQANDKNLAGQNIATIKLVMDGKKDEEGQVAYLPNRIEIEKLVLGNNTINFTISFQPFSESNFKYFNKNPLKDENGQDTHIDFSEVASFADMAVNTINTQGFQFAGDMNLSLIGIDAITSHLDVEINLSDAGKVSAHVEVKTDAFMGATWGGINPKFTTWETFNKRVATLDFSDGQLKLVQKTYQSRDRVKTLFDKTYVGSEILSSIVEIFAETLGLTDLAYNVMKDQISKIEAHPTLEKAILGYRKEVDSSAEVDKFILSLAGENVTGMSGFKDFDLNITSSAPYLFKLNEKQKQVKFLETISTFINIADAVKIHLNLDSATGENNAYVSSTNETNFQFHTNEYYRQRYINHVHDIQFRENGGTPVDDITNIHAGQSITLPVLENKVTVDEQTHTRTTWAFDGWWTTSTFEKGTKFLSNVAPNENLVLYAKWKVLNVEQTYLVKIHHNEEVVQTLGVLEGQTLTLADLKNVEGVGSRGAEFFFKSDNTKFVSWTANGDVELYFRNYCLVSFDVTWVKAGNWTNNGTLVDGGPAKPESFLVLEGTEINPSQCTVANFKCKYKWGLIEATHTFKLATWNTTGCTSVAKGITKAEGNAAYSVLNSFVVNEDVTLFATWAWA